MNYTDVPDALPFNGSEYYTGFQNAQPVRFKVNPPQRYVAILNQTGTDDPVATRLIDTLSGKGGVARLTKMVTTDDPIKWTYISVDTYHGVKVGAFPADRTIYPATAGYVRLDDDTIEFTGTAFNYPIEITVYPAVITEVPMNFSGVGGVTQVALSWDTVAGADGYILERSDSGSNWLPIYNGSTNTFTDAGLYADTQFFYRLHAFKSGQEDSGYTFTDGTTSP